VTDRTQARPPWPLAVLAALGGLFLVLPMIGLLQRAPWSELPRLLSEPSSREAIRVSLVVAGTATVLSLAMGVPLGWVLARVPFRGRSIVRAFVLVPLVLPPVVGGTALLFALGRRGLIGQYLDQWFGVVLPFSTAGAVLAATFVALPFLVLTVEAGVRSLPDHHEEVARTLGAGRWTVFQRITLPLLAPSIAAGAALAFARAIGEFGATVTFAGNLPGRTRTLPLAIFTALEQDPDTALALGVVLLVVSLTVLIALRGRLRGPA
jgi:molybdate transport system permease protein